MGWIFLLIYIVGWHVGMYGMFKKAGITPWKALIPFYNTWLIVEKTNIRKVWFWLQLIPIAGQFITIWITIIFVMLGEVLIFLPSIANFRIQWLKGRIAQAEIAANAVDHNDVVIGVAASGKTPFSIAAILAARSAGALTIAIANNPDTALLAAAEHALVAATGSELIAGSTRMKAGTAQKAILNLISTATMLRCGRVYRGLMVDMVISNEKLLQRAQGMVETLTDRSADAAAAAVEAADGNIKKAVMIAMGLSISDATAALAAHDGNLRSAIESLKTGA